MSAPPPSRRHVVVLNNYDLARVDAEVGRGDKPAHHLFGCDALARAGWTVTWIARSSGPRWLQTLDRLFAARRSPLPLGSLAPQLAAARLARRGGVIYSPCQTETHALSYARACGLGRGRLVTLAHHPLRRGRAAPLREPFLRWQLAGTAAFPALAAAVARDLASAAGHGVAFAPTLRWGPDLAYYERFRRAGPGTGVVAAGRTGRDWPTLLHAAAHAGVPTTIFASTPPIVAPPAPVHLHLAPPGGELPYPEFLPALANARVVAIPLQADVALAGLTSLVDALGLGKPVLMTRHPLIDLDIEAEGIGRWLAPQDVAGWSEALRWFDAHPHEAEEMGRRARMLAERSWNYARFCADLETLLRHVADAP